MQYKIIPVTSFAQNCTIIWCDKTRKAAMVDPGGEAKRLINALNELEVEVDKILITHGHLDHVGAAKELADHLSAKIYGPSQEDHFWLNNLPLQSAQFGLPLCLSFEPDYWLKEGDKIDVGEESLDVLHCAGHTPGHIVFIHQLAKLALVGDVLFHGSVGRTDFPMGSFPHLMHAIKQKLLPLGDDFAFIPGHGPMSTFGHERQHNPYLQSHE